VTEPAAPASREADVLLSDGGTVHLRPIRPEDAPDIVDMHSRFSERTRYLRYFSAYPRIPPRDLERFVTVDHRDREALVAVLGDRIISVGRYDRLTDDEAEVAFVVEDAHQGRGIGSVLLEHLAEAAREVGIRRFVAEVLAENGQMVRMFTDAGYTPTRSFDEGVVHLSFDIAVTPRSLEVLRDREHRAEARSIARLLRPSSLAVVGASTRPGSVGNALLSHVVAGGFRGAVHAVNPAAAPAGDAPPEAAPAGDGPDAPGTGDVPWCASVLDVPGPVDLALVAVPAPAVAGVVAECARKGVHGLVVVSGGFGETDEAGRARERDLVETARAGGMRVVGPNCLGVVNADPEVRLNASLVPRLPPPGRVGLFAQSGALGVAVLDQATRLGLGVSSFVSAGNRADVSGNDLMQHWQDDPATEVVLLYLESFGNPRKFARVASRLARRKPVAAVKSRAVPPGLAGPGPTVQDSGVEALFAQSGVIRVDTVPQLLDVALLLACQPLPRGRRVAVVGNSAALGLLAADACAGTGLEVADGWPVDLGADATPADLAAAVREALADDGVDALVVVFVPALATPGTAYADALLAETLSEIPGQGERARPVPVVSTFLAEDGVPERLRRPDPGGGAARGSIPSYGSPEAAVQALGRVAAYADWLRRPPGRVPDPPGVDLPAGRRVVEEALRLRPEGGPLDGPTAAALLAAYGIEVVPSRRCRSAEEAVAAAEALGYPTTLKVAEGILRHRVDLGGVRLDLGSAAQVRQAYEGLRTLGATEDVVVQPMRPPGVACLVEVVEDPSFGAVVGFGLAGVATELLGDRAWRAAPLTDADAAALVRAPLAAPLLFGHRGAAPADVDALADLLLRVGLLADALPEVRHVELHPVLAATRGLSVLHAAVRVGPPAARPDLGPRRLR